MKIITQYEANDGSKWNTEIEAIKRDAVIGACRYAESLLKPPVGDRKGYVQQSADAVLAYKMTLLKIAKQIGVHGADKVDDPAKVHNHGMMGRFIDDSGCTPLVRAWWRLMATDEQNREWEQPYYAMHPGTGPDIAL